MKNTFFKIVISNYNNMTYIKKCLDSILEQTFQDFKIIIVDDMSTDLSDKICEMYARKYPDKIVFIRLSEKGYAGKCRNVGIDYELDHTYTWFIDSDDYVYDKNVLQHVYNIAKENNFPQLIRGKCVLQKGISKCEQMPEISIEKMINQGAAPWRNFVHSQVQMPYFAEKQAKSNDVTWFLQICDRISDKSIAKTTRPTYVYNTASITSCQHAKNVKLSLPCINAENQYISQLSTMTFITKECNDFKKQRMLKFKSDYNTINGIKELLSYSCVITIDDDRITQLKKIFSHYKLDPFPNIINGSMDENLTGANNCTLSHLKTLIYAKTHNWPFVLIFEDDAYPCKDIYESLTVYLQQIPKNAEMLMFGWSRCLNKRQDFSNPFNRIKYMFYGSHAYLVFNCAFDKLIAYLQNKNFPVADSDAFLIYDNAYVVNRPFFIQYCEKSSINSQNYGYIYYGSHSKPCENFEQIEKIM